MPAVQNVATDRTPESAVRHDWRRDEAANLFAMPLMDLVYQAATVHRQHFDPNEIQLSTLLSIKTGKCAEDCAYCSQSSRYNTELETEPLIDLDEVRRNAAAAKAAGASRFCMGAAWRQLRERDVDTVLEMVSVVKELGMESCMTLGMLTREQAGKLAAGGLDYYNHNIDTSPEYYPEVISTRSFQDRLDTLDHVRDAGMKVCCGGIVGMGESREDRVGLLTSLANLPKHPESVPINMLVKIPGTPLAEAEGIDGVEFVRTIAAARIMMPVSFVRLSAGRETMSDEMQALCFMAGANSLFYGDKLLTTGNAEADRDQQLFDKLGLRPARSEH
ncbi:MAG: biotin synthase BioB [Gammaproteobacteria bacterium]|nr:MAG: biotin synthase BioB [Gammaproteobacteria bacterium]